MIGGGNIVRGAQLSKMGMDRVGADYMGMLGTVINALALQDVLEKAGIETRVMTAIRDGSRSPSRSSGAARMRHFEKGRVVIFAARHRQSVLLHRHRGGAARDSDPGRRHHQGDERRRRLQRRSEDAIRTRRVRAISYRDVMRRRARRDGSDRDHAVQGEQAADHRPQHSPSRRGCRSALRGERVGTIVQ